MFAGAAGAGRDPWRGAPAGANHGARFLGYDDDLCPRDEAGLTAGGGEDCVGLGG